MADGVARIGLGPLRTLFTLGTPGALSDAELLARFLARDEPGAEPAFAALVERHGPMVLGVCRRVLRDPHDADDAFQATFLVLARKAAGIGRPERLASWLYGVAYRTAVHARTLARRRRAKEGGMPAEPAANGSDRRDGLDELLSVLDDEMSRLPERLRGPLVLCDLEGLGRREAALKLGLPEGTLSSRLARGRGLLRDRLARRGMALGAGGLALAVVRDAGAAAIPPALAASTARAAMLFAARSTAAVAASAPVLTLTEGVLHMMILSKWKGLAMAVVATGLVATGAGVLAQSPHGVPITVDRLGQLENKLDRVLDALGKGGAGQTGTLAAPTPERADPALSRPRAEAAANPFGPDPGARPALARPASESSLERRIESIERRLAALEAQFEHHQARINATLRNGLQLGNELAPAPKSADPVPQAR